MTNLTTAEQLATSNAGQYNGNRYDQTSNPYGYSGSGYLTNFPQSMNDAATMMNAMDRLVTQVDTAATAAAAIVASRPKANSLTSFTIVSTGNATFATIENLLTEQPFFVGDFAKVFDDAAPADYIWGEVTAVDANSITVAIASHGGSGTFDTWTVIATGEQGAASGISSVVQDTSPMLGGNLASNGHNISVGVGDQLALASDSAGIEMNGSLLDQPVIRDYGEALNQLGTVMNTVALTFTSGNHNACTLGGNASFTLPSGLSTALKIGSSLRIAQAAGQAYTITWPGNVTWVGSAPSAPSAGMRLEVLFDTIDGGATYIGFTRFVNV